jgi:hypothetical protein
MSTTEMTWGSNQSLEALQEDMPSLACDAAIELDNLSRGRATELRAVEQLTERIRNSVMDFQDVTSPSSLFNPTAAVVMSGALSEFRQTQPIRGLEELKGETEKVKVQLDELLKSPHAFAQSFPDQVSQMRTFCVALSRRASALLQPQQRKEPHHPFRR